jgi:hypothetical protein
MSKVDIKNISGGVLSFTTFRDIANNEILLMADDATLGSDITGIIKESPLNTFQAYIYEGKIEVIEDDTPITDVVDAVNLFNAEIVLASNFDQTTILRANSLVTQAVDNAAAGTIVQFEHIIESRGVTISNGEIIGQKTATFVYDLELNIDVVQGFSGVIETWFEYYHPLLASWQPYVNSGKRKDFSRMSEGYVAYSGVLNLIAGVKFRLKIRTTTNNLDVKLLAEALDNGVGVVSAGITVH